MKIVVLKNTETLAYAADELKKYVTAMSNGNILPVVEFSQYSVSNTKDTITLGLLHDLNLPHEDVNDPFIEDVIDIDVTGLCGYIAGSNERSVLMGVYKYCYSAGCRFIRPGENGDYIPTSDLIAHNFKYRKKADNDFRGQCCEGAISYEHMRDTVYWLPKIGMNMYMIEGLVPYGYMHKWYGHVYNTHLRTPGQVTEYKTLEKYVSRLERDINKTGVQLHTLGHGWMFESIGIHNTDPKNEKTAISALTDDKRSYLAQLNGERTLYGGNTFYTHFCYSNPSARRALVSYLVDYIKEKPHVDFVHVWLADAANNQCECEECVKKTPSDWYVILLNELDAELTKIGSKARIAFIAYVDTVRPPVTERLVNPKRFILITAVGQFYEDGYPSLECKDEIPPYERNNFVQFEAPLRLKCCRDWKSLSDDIPSVVFEYRYYMHMYCDPGYMQMSREAYRDMKNIGNVSFNGCMSDQTHRMYMPTSLPLITMGETLYDTELNFDVLTDEYFLGAFGEDGLLVKEYLDKLTDLSSPSNFRVGGKGGIEEEGVGDLPPNKRPWINNPDVMKKASTIPALLDEFLPIIKRNVSLVQDAARKLSWVYLEYHSKIARFHGEILYFGASGDMDRARAVFDELREYISLHELEFHNAFDVFLYTRAISQKLGIKMPDYFS